MPEELVIDTNVLVAIVDSQDKFHSAASGLVTLFVAGRVRLYYFDCVMIETVGVLCRRLEERRRSELLSSLLETLDQTVLQTQISWVGRDLVRLYRPVVELVRQTQGQLNFNDALIALVCRERNITTIASFDRDFDQIAWLKRISKPEDLTPTDAIEEREP